MNLYSDLSAPICRRCGISQTSFDMLIFWANNPDLNTARDACTVHGIRSAMASMATESLIQNGLMLRQNDLKDRRVRRLVPTEKAASIIREGRTIQERFAKTLRQGVTEQEIEVFLRVADKLIANVSNRSGE